MTREKQRIPFCLLFLYGLACSNLPHSEEKIPTQSWKTNSPMGAFEIYKSAQCQDGTHPFEVEFHKLDPETKIDRWLVNCRSGQREKLEFEYKNPGDSKEYAKSWKRFLEEKKKAEQFVLAKDWKSAESSVIIMLEEEPQNPYALHLQLSLQTVQRKCKDRKTILTIESLPFRQELFPEIREDYKKTCYLSPIE